MSTSNVIYDFKRHLAMRSASVHSTNTQLPKANRYTKKSHEIQRLKRISHCTQLAAVLLHQLMQYHAPLMQLWMPVREDQKRKISDNREVRTRASEETRTLTWRLRPLGQVAYYLAV